MPDAIYQVTDLKLISLDVYQVLLAPESEPLHYLAGQYIEACIPSESGRFFSIAHAPNAAHSIELHVRCQANNIDAQKFIYYLTQHSTLTLRGPLGKCFYHSKPELPAIMIAVGTGFAPMKAMLEQAFIEQAQADMTLFWAGKCPDDLYCLSLVEKWAQTISNFHLVPVLDRQDALPDWQGAVGNVLDHVLAYYPDLAKHHIYCAGPLQLTVDALDRFAAHGAQTGYLYSDALDLIDKMRG